MLEFGSLLSRLGEVLLDHASNFLGEFVNWLSCGFSFLDEGFVFNVISEESSSFSNDSCGFLVF